MSNKTVAQLGTLSGIDDAYLVPVYDPYESAPEKLKHISGEDLKSALAQSTYAALAGGMRGVYDRSTFTWVSNTQITIGQGTYYHVGTVTQTVIIPSDINLTYGSLSADTWYYIYIDDSELTSSSVALGQIVASSVTPIESFIKAGWYKDDDLAIFMFLTDGSGNIIEFQHAGKEHVQFADFKGNFSGDVDTAHQTVALTIPPICREAQVSISCDPSGETTVAYAYWCTTGQTGTTGHRFGQTDQDHNPLSVYTQNKLITDSSQQIDIWYSAGGTNTMGVYTEGFYLPKYM